MINIKDLKIDKDNIITTKNGLYYQTNEVGKIIIENLQKNKKKGEIIKLISEKYPNKNPKEILIDVEDFLRLLNNLSIVY